jgi:hypothetical protein
MSAQVKMSLRGRLPEPSFPIKFSDDDMDAIVSHVPGADGKRMMRLADVLNEWANHDLQKAFLIYPDKAIALERLRAIRPIAQHAQGLRLALENFERFGSSWLIRELISKNFSDYRRDEALNTRKLANQMALLPGIEAAAKTLEPIFKKATDQRRNITAYLLLLDLAQIYEWLTDQRPQRGSDDREHPFDNFVGASWSAIFGNVHGIQAALKNWAAYRNEFADKSPVLFNISLRRPEWRLFDTADREPST